MKTTIVPSVLDTTIKGFTDRYNLAKSLSPKVHVDLMDGSFVLRKAPAISKLPDLKGAEVHLMVSRPDEYIPELAEKHCEGIIFHFESCPDRISEVIFLIHENKMKAYIAIKPQTDIKDIEPFIEQADGFLIMGVEPGVEHQTMLSDAYTRISELRSKTKLPILFDGGVRLKNAIKLVHAGVSELISGSYIFESKSPQKAYKELKAAVK